MEDLGLEIQTVLPFRELNQSLLHQLFKLCRNNSFLAFSSVCVKSAVPQNNNILSNERPALSEKL